ncbi:putative transporter YycB [Halobacillus andaensis]|uniref:Transporter YycB n=1 Tax=Halobacillus andaensis TaxID=1176239 RepID=A0A917B7P0_HALAA|nr:MFS transporter [Halobacillus andaensis]MBP2005834.1 CP family cyanate transporter-like MFS transporter [Halobacillus andaensis]GGF25728.1 putative transporter YycB [Halobacillus andaensis]
MFYNPIHKRKWLIVGIVLIALNLRPSLTAVGPLISSIREDLSITNGIAGMLTTLPLIAFAVLSALAPRLGLKVGQGQAIFIGMFVLTVGILVRSIEWVTTLFIGTALIGIGVAICNVLLPSLVKQQFPDKVGLLTGIYSISLSAWAAVGSGISFPLAQRMSSGWQGSLGVWAVLGIIAMVVWIPQTTIKRKPVKIPKINIKNSPLFRSKLAWQVTIFMGMQSFMFYCLITWLPEIMQSRGMTPSTAGWMLSFMQIVGLPGTFITPVLAGRITNQRGIVLSIGILYLIGLSGMLFGSGVVWLTLCIAIIGLAQGSSVSLALTFLSLRASTATQASNLSGMAQSIGYALAAVGPILIGMLYDFTQTWTPGIVIFIGIVVIMVSAGIGAGRDKYIEEVSLAAK